MKTTSKRNRHICCQSKEMTSPFLYSDKRVWSDLFVRLGLHTTHASADGAFFTFPVVVYYYIKHYLSSTAAKILQKVFKVPQRSQCHTQKKTKTIRNLFHGYVHVRCRNMFTITTVFHHILVGEIYNFGKVIVKSDVLVDANCVEKIERITQLWSRWNLSPPELSRGQI